MDSHTNIFECEWLPEHGALPSLLALVSNLRSFLPKLTLVLNAHGLWIRSTTAALSIQAFFSIVDYFSIFMVEGVLEIPVLTHELDAILSALAAGHPTGGVLSMWMAKDDMAHLHIAAKLSNSTERAFVRVSEQHAPFAAGALVPSSVEPLPRLLLTQPGCNVLCSTLHSVSPKNLTRTLRSHKAQRVALAFMANGALLVASEYGGNARQSEIGGFGAHQVLGAASDGRTYLSGLLISLLKIYVGVDSSRFRLDREEGDETPLQILATLGHASYMRAYVPDSQFTFSTKPCKN